MNIILSTPTQVEEVLCLLFRLKVSGQEDSPCNPHSQGRLAGNPAVPKYIVPLKLYSSVMLMGDSRHPVDAAPSAQPLTQELLGGLGDWVYLFQPSSQNHFQDECSKFRGNLKRNFSFNKNRILLLKSKTIRLIKQVVFKTNFKGILKGNFVAHYYFNKHTVN